MKNQNEKNDLARGDTPTVIRDDNRTASEDTVLSPSVSPAQVSNEHTVNDHQRFVNAEHADRLEAEVAQLRNQLAYLRDAVAKTVGYALTGDADADDAQLVDRLGERAPCLQCGVTESADGDWYRLCGGCRWDFDRRPLRLSGA